MKTNLLLLAALLTPALACTNHDSNRHATTPRAHATATVKVSTTSPKREAPSPASVPATPAPKPSEKPRDGRGTQRPNYLLM